MAIITATQLIADNLVTTWTASSTQPGVASAIDPTQLVREVQQVRRSADTVIVYVHWGTETQACPNPQQQPLAQQLIKAGADIVIGSGAHVLLGAGYLGGAYVDYGLGNLAFYDDTAPETNSGTLIVTAQGRHITGAVWRPATILDGVPQPLSGTPATTAVSSWNAARSCTNLSVTPTTTIATMRGETVPFVAPPAAPTTTTTTAASASGGSTTTTTAAPTSGGSTTTTTAAGTTTSTTTPASTTTQATDNAGGSRARLRSDQVRRIDLRPGVGLLLERLLAGNAAEAEADLLEVVGLANRRSPPGEAPCRPGARARPAARGSWCRA